MAINFDSVQAEFRINGIKVINNAVVVGTVNGTSREATLSVKFIGSIGEAKVKAQVLDEKGKEISINFNEQTYTGKFLFNGVYTVKITVYEESANTETSPNEKTFILKNLQVTGCYTTLSSFNPDIVDKNTGIIIKNGDVFSNGEQIIPDLSQELPFDFEIDEYSLTRNGLVIAYNPYDDRTISDDGEYYLKIVIRRRGLEVSGDIMVKTFTRKFSIEKSFINTIREEDIYIYNKLNNTAIINGYKYIERDIVLDWDVSAGIEVKSAIVNYHKDAKADHITNTNGKIEVDADYPPILLGDFEKGATILSNYGVYTLDLTLAEFSNSKNKLNITRYFIIERDIVVLTSNLLQCYDCNNQKTLTSTTDNFLTTDAVIPLISYDEDLDDKILVDVVARLNGETFDDFVNGETVLSQQGVYSLTGRVYEPGAIDKNKYTKTYTFSVVQPPKNLEGLDINLINKESNEPVVNGTTYEETFNYYNFIVNSVKDSDVYVYYEHTSITGLVTKSSKVIIDSKNPLRVKEAGRYLVKLSIQDKTINPNTGQLQYPYNVYEKTYVFNIFKTQFAEGNDPNKMVYINGQLLDPAKKNPIWKSLSEDSTELNFSLIKPGSYNIVLLNKNNYNFNYTVSDYDLIVVDPTMQQRPTIVSDPPSNVSTSTSYKVYITYPTGAAKNSLLYRDEFDEDTSWKTYPEDGIIRKKACKIFAKYQDIVTGDWIENLEGEAFTPGPLIDNSPVYVDDKDIIGIVNNGRYYAVTIDIKRKLNHKYTPYIKLPSSTEFTACELGDMFKRPGSYIVKIEAESLINGNKGTTNEIRFTIDHTDPNIPTVTLRDDSGVTISNNGRTDKPVNVTLGNVNYTKYLYEGYLNNRLFFKTTEQSTGVTINKIIRDGSYYLTVVAVDKASGRRSMVHSNFTIASKTIVLSGVPLKPHRYQQVGESFVFKDNIQPYDGELLLRCNTSWKPLGDVGIYRDGLVLNKLVELDASVLQLQVSTDEVESDIILNKTICDSLTSIKKDLYYSLLRMMIENSQLDETVARLLNYCEETEVPPLDTVVTDRLEKNNVYNLSKANSNELTELGSKTLSKSRNNLKEIITNLQQNSNLIGELSFLSAVYKVKNKIF